MRSQSLVCLLLTSLVFGQAAPPPAPPAAGSMPEQNAPAATDKAPEAKAPEVKVGPDDTVITIKGFCADASKQGDACKTDITRAQFEKLAEALQPGMSPALRRQLATRYSWALRMSAEAEKRGLDKGPTFEEKMYFFRMQVLSQELGKALQEDSAKIPDADISDYYTKNQASYEQASLIKIFVPHTKQLGSPKATPPKTGAKAGAKTGTSASAKTAAANRPPTEAQKKAAEEAMKKLAAALRARAAQGEDPDKLEKEAYVAAGLPPAQSTKMEKARRAQLPPAHQAVMDLKAGEVSEVISDASGYYIYKLVSKETLSLEAVTPEIRKALSAQRYRESMQSFQSNVDLNDAYFGAAARPGMPMPPRGQTPPAQRPPDPD